MRTLFFLILLLNNLHAFSQEMNQHTIDSLNIEAVENFQKRYWLSPIKH